MGRETDADCWGWGRLLPTLVLLAAVACGDGSAVDAGHDSTISLVPAGALAGEVGSAGELVEPSNWTVDERGFVYVVDTKPAVIKVFDDSGRFVRTIGREGAGPGEFRMALIAVRGGRLLVHDPMAARVSLFDTSGTYVRGWIGACCYWYKPFLHRDGRIAIPTEPPDGMQRAFLHFDTLGALLDTLSVPRAHDAPQWTLRRGTQMVMSTRVPFSRQSDVELTPDGDAIHGWSGAYRLVVSRGGRDTLRTFGRTWTPEPLPDARRDSVYDARVRSLAKNMEVDEATIRQQVDKGLMPTTLPAFTGISVDFDGNPWLHIDEDSSRTRFDVFDTTGAFVGRTEVAALVTKWQLTFGPGVLYFRQDTDEGYPRIVRYRIVRR